ncbi:MAG TPA: NUDIX domain-containing protein [Blastocatellia bacterium]
MQPTLTFGRNDPSLPKRIRPCAYAVVFGKDGLIATVQEAGRFFLPGGGIEGLESPEQAVHREVVEELGRQVTIVRFLGCAIQYLQSEGVCYEAHARFFLSRLGEPAGSKPEYALAWTSPKDLYLESHRWGAEIALSTAENPPDYIAII